MSGSDVFLAVSLLVMAAAAAVVIAAYRTRRMGRMVIGLAVVSLIVAADTAVLLLLFHSSSAVRTRISIRDEEGWWALRYERDGRAFETASEMHGPAGEPVAIDSRSRAIWPVFLWLPHVATFHDHGVRRVTALRVARDAIQPLVISVDRPADFDRWFASESSPAIVANPTGAAIFTTARCARCHEIRGAVMRAEEAAPDLTHIATRRLIAGRVPNDTASLMGWIVDPQSVHRATRMPSNAIDPGKLLALTQYLQQLR